MTLQVNDTAFDPSGMQDSGDLDGGTPGELAAQQAPAATNNRIPVDVPRLQREYTQSNQRWSEVAKALELPKDAPVDVVISRLAELQSSPRGQDDEAMDPETYKRTRALENREWAAEAAIYGETANYARTLFEKVRSHPNMSPSDVATSFYAAVDAAVEARMAGTSVDEEAAPEPDQPTFGQEAPMTRPRSAGLDIPLDVTGTERENRISDWVRSGLENLGVRR